MAVAAATLAIIATVAAVAGAGAGAYSAVQAGEAQSKAAKFNAAVARNNSIMAAQQAQYEAAQTRRKGLMVQSEQVSRMGKSGTQIGVGSGADVEYGSQLQNEMDALAALYTGKVSSTGQESRARLSILEGQNAVTSSYWNAGASILSGAGTAARGLGEYNRATSQDSQPQF